MNQLGILYRYELKKLSARRLVWITCAACLLFAAVMVSSGLTGKYYVDGQMVDTHYHMFLVDREYARTLSGRKIDQALLEETLEGYRKIPPAAERYTLTEEYQAYARPYSMIFNLMGSWTGKRFASLMEWEPEEDALYTARLDTLEAAWNSGLLSDREKEYWRQKESQLETPMTFYYYDGYNTLLNSFTPVGLMSLLFTAISLSGIFPEEHTRRTDQLMLSCSKGRSTAYLAKIYAGITVVAAFSLLITAFTVVLTLGVYGTDGFHTALQIHHYDYSYPLTFGQACILVYGILVITSVFMGILVMVLSELVRSSVATLALSTGFILLGSLFHIPFQYRVLSQVWRMLPTTLLKPESVFSLQLLTLPGHCFTLWQAAPAIYVLCGIAAAAAGKRIFARDQA